jgi:hypothetical protein
LRRDELYVEELLCNDAAKIVIDQEFKNDLKNRIMFGDKYNNITQLPKHKNNFMQNRYLKIASGFVICVFVSGTIFKAINVPDKNMLAKIDVIAPISTPESLTKTAIEKTSGVQPKKDIAKVGNADDQQKEIKDTENSDDHSAIVKNVEKTDTGANKNTSNGNSQISDDEINEGLTSGGKSASVATDLKGPIDVPTMETVKEDAGETLKCYDSRYSLDEKKLVDVKDGGIYIKDLESSKEKKLISYNEKTQVIEKPNFTPSEGIIYYKAEKIALEDGAIYLTDKNGQESTKIVDGKNPMISKNGKSLVYEAKGEIYILNLGTNSKRLVDIGKNPAWSDNGNLISYVKEDIDKRSSNLWVFDLTSESARRLTNSEEKIKNNSIESWAEAVRSEDITNKFDVTNKYSYFESIWSSTNKEIYVIRKNNEAQIFEFVRFSLDK